MPHLPSITRPWKRITGHRILSGFTLTEVVVSAVVFLIFCIPIIGLLSTTKYTQKRISKRLGAILLAQGILDEVRHNSEIYGTTSPRQLFKKPEGYQLQKTFHSFEEADGVLLFRVKVKWSEFKKTKEIEMNTLVSTRRDFYEFKK